MIADLTSASTTKTIGAGLSPASAVTSSLVGCKLMILIEAPSSAHHTVDWDGANHSPRRRRPNEILHRTPSVLLRRRPARALHVHLHTRPEGTRQATPQPTGRTSSLPRRHRAVHRPGRRRCRVHLHLVLAGRPLHRTGHPLCPRTCIIHEGHPRREGQERPHRFPQDRRTPARR